jgi:hypothetical protein
MRFVQYLAKRLERVHRGLRVNDAIAGEVGTEADGAQSGGLHGSAVGVPISLPVELPMDTRQIASFDLGWKQPS